MQRLAGGIFAEPLGESSGWESGSSWSYISSPHRAMHRQPPKANLSSLPAQQTSLYAALGEDLHDCAEGHM